MWRPTSHQDGSTSLDLIIDATITDGSIIKAGEGTLGISGTQTYTALLAQAGTTKLFSALGTGTSTVNVTPTGASATVNFNTSQTLASLTIGNGGVVNLTSEPAPAPPLPFDDLTKNPTQPVPEPCALSLLAAGCAILFRRRKR